MEWKLGNMGSISMKNMEWKCGDMGSRSYPNHEMEILEIFDMGSISFKK